MIFNGKLQLFMLWCTFANVTKETGENILNFSTDCAYLLKHELTS